MKNLVVAGLAGLSLSACVTINAPMHGMGDDNDNIVTQYPIETAFLNIYPQPRSERLYATVDEQTIVADINVTPKGATVFNNKSVQAADIGTITKRFDQITNQSVATNYFTTNPLEFHGFTDTSGRYSLSKQTAPIPKLASIGDSSQLITENVYSDSSMRKKVGSYKQSWSLTRENKTQAWLCIETSENLLLNNVTHGSSTECYKINAQGDILASKIAISQPVGIGSYQAITFTSR